MIHRLYRQQFVPTPIDEVWAYFATPQNLNEMTPDDMKFEIVHGGEEEMFEGQIIEYRVQFIPLFKSLWLTEIAHVKEGSYFVDEQRIGPYRLWYHEHSFEAVEGGTRIIDQVTYAMPFGFLGEIVHAIWVGSRLKGIFDFRKKKVKELFG
ncbi:MAG: SRPBCC family protein [Anaerolineales bacterium]|jgi:ligand-binding SRPBCC domain-containing protein